MLKELIESAMTPERLLGLAEKMIPPSTRVMLQCVSQGIKSTFDIANKPLPAITIKEKPEECKVAVVYQFTNADDAHAFFVMEQDSIAVMQAVDKVIKDHNGKVQQQGGA